jgi:hypothetical protein
VSRKVHQLQGDIDRVLLVRDFIKHYGYPETDDYTAYDVAEINSEAEDILFARLETLVIILFVFFLNNRLMLLLLF